MVKNEMIGKKYRIGDVTFEILNVEEYPLEKVSERYKELLKFRPGHLVAVMYRGTLIPNITVDDGVVRIREVSVDGKAYDRPGAISAAIGIDEAMYAYEITEV